jgi:HD-GYP domain-containing protein (c-di-GMP phosphodiesterase class II)
MKILFLSYTKSRRYDYFMRQTKLIRPLDSVEKTKEQPNKKGLPITNNTISSPGPQSPSSPPSPPPPDSYQTNVLGTDDLLAFYDIFPQQVKTAEPAVPQHSQSAVLQQKPATPPQNNIGITEEVPSKKEPGEHAQPVPSVKIPAQDMPPRTGYHGEKKGEPPKVVEPFSLESLADIEDEIDLKSDIAIENKKEMEVVHEIYKKIIIILEEIYADGKAGKEIQIDKLAGPINQLIGVCKFSNFILRRAVRLKTKAERFTTHSLNMAILAIKIGMSRNYNDDKLFLLVLSSLLQNVGMTLVSAEVLGKIEKLDPEEFREIMRHVQYSVQIVSKAASNYPLLVPIISQVHERENGTGYPQGLSGENIIDLAKIIGLCDVYIALTESKIHRARYSGYQALQQLISKRGEDFDPKVIKSLIDVVSVFPLESLIKLNNGSICRVIDVSTVHPTKPKLRVLINSDGEKLYQPVFIDLEKEPLLYVENPDIEEGVVL